MQKTQLGCFNLAPEASTHSTMKLWKFAIIGLILCGAVPLFLLFKSMSSAKVQLSTNHRGSSSSLSLSPTSAPASTLPVHQRRIRSAEKRNSVISEFIEMFQSFTEGELKQVIGTLVERKGRRDAQQSKRTKRARKRTKPCALREVEMTVSQLGLGYVSDETIVFHYCSGKCTSSRRNYDLTLAFIKRSRLLSREQREKTRHSPCCRPTEYETGISFLDNVNRYHTIHEFSAQACGCV